MEWNTNRQEPQREHRLSLRKRHFALVQPRWCMDLPQIRNETLKEAKSKVLSLRNWDSSPSQLYNLLFRDFHIIPALVRILSRSKTVYYPHWHAVVFDKFEQNLNLLIHDSPLVIFSFMLIIYFPVALA